MMPENPTLPPKNATLMTNEQAGTDSDAGQSQSQQQQ